MENLEQQKNMIKEFCNILEVIHSCKNNDHIHGADKMMKNFIHKWKSKKPELCLDCYEVLQDNLQGVIEEYYVR
jgi:hypothetical protein